MLLKLNLQRFAPAIVFITINFDNHISKVTYSRVEWTASGQSQQTAIVDGSTGVFTVTLDSGYVLDTVTLGSDFENTNLSAKTDTSFSLLFGNTSGGTITITSKQTSSSGGTNNLKFGMETPIKLYMGTTEVLKAYMGETLVYEKFSSSGETWLQANATKQ